MLLSVIKIASYTQALYLPCKADITMTLPSVCSFCFIWGGGHHWSSLLLVCLIYAW